MECQTWAAHRGCLPPLASLLDKQVSTLTTSNSLFQILNCAQRMYLQCCSVSWMQIFVEFQRRSGVFLFWTFPDLCKLHRIFRVLENTWHYSHTLPLIRGLIPIQVCVLSSWSYISIALHNDWKWEKRLFSVLKKKKSLFLCFYLIIDYTYLFYYAKIQY